MRNTWSSRGEARRKPLETVRLVLIVSIMMLCIAVGILFTFTTHAANTLCMNIIVPAYSYPNPPTMWDGAMSASAVGTIIANVDSGPGSSVDSNYTSVIGQAQADGIDVLGYVWTDYGSASTASVESQINQWKSFYGVTSIFLDGTSSQTNEESYYQTLATYIHDDGGIVELNPGDIPDQGYMNIGDIVNIFEGNQASYTSYTPPSWINDYPTAKISNVVYGASGTSSLQADLNEAANDHTGNVYITDQTGSNPYSSLPSYWSTENATITQACNSNTGGGGGSSNSGGGGGASSSGTTSQSSSSSASNQGSSATTASSSSSESSESSASTPSESAASAAKTSKSTTTTTRTTTSTKTVTAKKPIKHTPSRHTWAIVPWVILLCDGCALLIWKLLAFIRPRL